MRFYIELDNKQLYLMELDFNFNKYRIKKGYLYKGFKKLGKIVKVWEDNEKVIKITKEEYRELKKENNSLQVENYTLKETSNLLLARTVMYPIINKIMEMQNCDVRDAIASFRKAIVVKMAGDYNPMQAKYSYALYLEVEE